MSRKFTAQKSRLPIPDASAYDEPDNQSELGEALESQRAELLRLFQQHETARQAEAQAREQALQAQLQELTKGQTTFQTPTIESALAIGVEAIEAASKSKAK